MTAEQYKKKLAEITEDTATILDAYDEQIKNTPSKDMKQFLSEGKNRAISDFREDLDKLHDSFRGIEQKPTEDAHLQGE